MSFHGLDCNPFEKESIVCVDVKKFCFRVLFYVLGLFVMAIGVTFASNSNLGIDGYPTSLVFLGTVVSAVFVGVVMGPIQTFIIPPSAASALERLPRLPPDFPYNLLLGAVSGWRTSPHWIKPPSVGKPQAVVSISRPFPVRGRDFLDLDHCLKKRHFKANKSTFPDPCAPGIIKLYCYVIL